MKLSSSSSDSIDYQMADSGAFIITNYNQAKPFSSFLPGIAGTDGIPMWAFYVNRGQCLCSAGIQDKNHAIMEYLPANRAYNLVSRQGFRTFVKIMKDGSEIYYEPFQNHYRDRHQIRTQRMVVKSSSLRIEEVNESLGLEFTVNYCTVPSDNYAGLIRTLNIHNLSDSETHIEALDGLPVIVPYGVDDFCLKQMRRTIEAFVEVRNLDNMAPYFKAKVEPSDRPDAKEITRGNFYVGIEQDRTGTRIAGPIVDPSVIFGSRSDHDYPERFLAMSIDDLSENQMTENQFPCAMGKLKATIPPQEIFHYSSIIGHAFSLDSLNEMVPRITQADYFTAKAKVNHEIIESLTQANLVCSSETVLDNYVRQNFLDNTLRGGHPVALGEKNKRSIVYMYARKHGDLERDYNDFQLMPTKYSQGNGNFRDINQNRRSDLLFNPDIGAFNVEYFYNLIQLDGFNPLILKETRFQTDDPNKVTQLILKHFEPENRTEIEALLSNSFSPGELLFYLDSHQIELGTDRDIFLKELIDLCSTHYDAEHGEGFWVDHWTYNLDLLENYFAVYPDRINELIFAAKNFTFFNNPHRVEPREKQYVLWDGQPARLKSVVLDAEKMSLIESYDKNSSLVRTKSGRGDVFYTTLFAKLFCLIVNKLASLDPAGVGVEMEAGKPGWYDALNGLPGHFGSSVCETIEIKRHIIFLLDRINEYQTSGEDVVIYNELAEFMGTMHDLLGESLTPFEYWDRATSAKERYRNQTRLGVRGDERAISLEYIIQFFAAALKKLDAAIELAKDRESETISTYFRYDVTKYEILNEVKDSGKKEKIRNGEDNIRIKPLGFRQECLPLFLEGPVHYLRCLDNPEESGKFAAQVKKSGLYDQALKMYKVNISLEDQPLEIGRARVFSPGWLENESIWLHMEYKYILELLRNKLYTEFYQEFKSVLVPFMDPNVYGRSVLENSSFIVSSAFPDSSMHGNGFVARLSGATAEFIHILMLMSAGPRPFQIDSGGRLRFKLQPALPNWLFTSESKQVRIRRSGRWIEEDISDKSYAFMMLGSVLVVYRNPELRDTFGENAARPIEWKISFLNGDVKVVNSETLDCKIAKQIRNRDVERIDVLLR